MSSRSNSGGKQPVCTLSLYIAVFLAAAPAGMPLAAQCIVGNPGAAKPTSSPLSRLNQELPGWLCFTLGYRTRFEGYTAGNFEAGNSDSYLLTRFRLGVLLKPVRWFQIFAELQDADAFWKTPLWRRLTNPPGICAVLTSILATSRKAASHSAWDARI